MISPKSHALRYRIWAYASPRGWDVTASEIAEALGEDPRSIGATLQGAGWTGRVRLSQARGARYTTPGFAAASSRLVELILSGRVEVDE